MSFAKSDDSFIFFIISCSMYYQEIHAFLIVEKKNLYPHPDWTTSFATLFLRVQYEQAS